MLRLFLFSIIFLLNQAFATSSLIVGAGYDEINDVPILASSSNNGSTWHLTGFGPSLALYDVSYTAAACNPALTWCVSVGTMFDQPMVLQTSNLGAGWSYAQVTNGMHADLAFNAAACTATTCMAVGNRPAGVALVQSTNKTTWNIINLQTVLGVGGGTLYDVDCDNSTCVTVGNLGSKNPALIMQSADNGATWTKETITPTLSSPSTGSLFSVDCNATACVAVGTEIANTGKLAYPTIYQLQGTSWVHQPIDKPLQGGFKSVSCTATVCTAVGYTVTPEPAIIFATNANNASTWTTTNIPVAIAAVPNAVHTAQISCDTAQCFAVNTFYGASTTETTLLSNATGTWESLPLATNIATGGVLNAISCNAAGVCYAGGMDASNSPLLLENSSAGTWSTMTVPSITTEGWFNGLSVN